MEDKIEMFIRVLVKRRDLLDAAIARVQRLTAEDVFTEGTSPPKRPGRKSVSMEERHRISDRMKASWAGRQRKKSDHAAGGPEGWSGAKDRKQFHHCQMATPAAIKSVNMPPPTLELQKVEQLLLDTMQAARAAYQVDARYRDEYELALTRFNRFVIDRKVPEDLMFQLNPQMFTDNEIKKPGRFRR
jgi:hypothetical protein